MKADFKSDFLKTQFNFQKTQEREMGTGRWISPETETFKSLCYAEIHYNSCQLNQCKSRRESIPVWESLGVQWTHIIHLLMAEYEISIKTAQEGIIVLSLTIFCKETFMHGQALSKKSHSEIDVQKLLLHTTHISFRRFQHVFSFRFFANPHDTRVINSFAAIV